MILRKLLIRLLTFLRPIKGFYNSLSHEHNGNHKLSPKTVKIIHGVLHSALKQAVANSLLHSNPADACTLPRMEKKELKPLDEDDITLFLKKNSRAAFRESVHYNPFYRYARRGSTRLDVGLCRL